MQRRELPSFAVLALGTSVALQRCCDLLAELGAEVIGLNTDHASGQRLLAELSTSADVVVYDAALDFCGLPVGSAQAQTARRQPVWCAITPYGLSGSLAGAPGSDLTVEAYSGLLATTGFAEDPPTRAGFPVASQMGAIYAAGAIMAALYHRELTGEAQTIDLSVHDCSLLFLTTFLAGGPSTEVRMGNRHPVAAPWNVYQARDGYVVLTCADDAQWHGLLDLIGRPGLHTEPAYQSSAGRRAAVDAVDAIVQEWVGFQSVEGAVRALDGIGVPAGPVLTVPEVLASPHYRQRSEASNPLIVAEPIRPAPVFGGLSVPRVAADGRAFLAILVDELSYSPETVDELVRRGVIRLGGTFAG